jgi:deoxyribose-phosphate aldolase
MKKKKFSLVPTENSTDSEGSAFNENTEIMVGTTKQEQREFDEFKHLRRIEGAKALMTKVELDLAYVSVDKELLKTACREANSLNLGAVCVLPCFVKPCVTFLGKDPVASLISVISYPAGADITEVKVHALKCAVSDGIDEAEIAAPMAYIKEGNWGYVKKQFKKIKKAAKGRAVRIMVETSFLAPAEVLKTCNLAADIGINGVVLSSYASQSGVPFDLVKKIASTLKDRCFIKVSGVKSRDDMSRYIDAGAQIVCSRDGLTLAHQILAAAE